MEPLDSAHSPASSLQTSLLPSDSDHSDDNEYEEFTPSIYVQHPPPRPDPIDSEASNTCLHIASGWALACFICLLFLPAILISHLRPNVGQPPTSRKSPAMAAFSNNHASLLNLLNPNGYSTFKNPGLNSSSDILVVYSGMGHHRHLLNDTFAFDLQTRQWARVLSGKHETKAPHPDPRWESAAVSIKNKGLLLLFGDALQWNSDGDPFGQRVGKSRKFDDQVWMLELPSLKWQAANITKTQRSSSSLIPNARKGHSVNVLETPPLSTRGLKAAAAAAAARQTQIKTETTLVLFGGVSAEGEELNDTWKATISWPNITWTLLIKGTDGLPTATPVKEQAKPLQRPSPRHGHGTALLEASDEIFQNLETRRIDDLEVEDTMWRYLVLFGGRDKTQFFNDLWMLNLDRLGKNANNNRNSNGSKAGGGKSGVWRHFQIDETSPIPPPRAHHTIAIYENKLYLWGGLSGPRVDISKPLDDLWVLSFETRRWYRLYKHGAWPLPRYLSASVVHQPQGAAEPRLYVFGGQSLNRCKLNDLWSLNLKSLIWSQLTPNFFAKRRCDKLFGKSLDYVGYE